MTDNKPDKTDAKAIRELKKVTTNTIQKMKQAGEKISMITAYDYSFARIFDSAGIDIILVGDSASNVMAGHTTTLPITLDQMIYHAQSVVRARERALIVVDIPFGSYQSNSEIALASAIRIMKESGGHTVKLEGGEEVIDSVKKIVSAGIPVMGHLGLTPQSINKFGTYVVRATEKPEADKLKKDALLLQEAGAFAIVLEKIPASLAKGVSKSLSIPTIGIGAGKYCDGQVLVMHDMLGINTEFKPRFLRQYLNLNEQVTAAIQKYIKDVKSVDFPGEGEQY
jgi:3-methyl-2-oxobutanoate hydroxymethyltransferase